jgi:nucleoside-diphosphate-sugar epimerase
VYGTARYTPIDEDHPLCAQSPYAASKIAADKLAESFHLSFGLPVATIRPFNTFGPRQSARAIIPTIISQLLATGGRASLGALDPARDFTFVEDTAQAFLAVADASGTVGKVTNVGTGRSISVGELAALAGEVLGIERIEIAQDPGRLRPANSEVMRLECNAGRLFERCGWKPGVDLKTGLRRTAEFIRAQPRLYRPETYTV